MFARHCLIAAVLAAGCSTATPPLPLDHPANADAAEALPSTDSGVLNLDKADPLSPGTAAPTRRDHGDHP